MAEKTLGRLSDADLARYRRAAAEKNALESGAVRTSLKQAAGVYELAWARHAIAGSILDGYDLDLDPDEPAYISPSTGRIYTRY